MDEKKSLFGDNNKTLLMGILNVTEDSFSADGTTSPEIAIAHAKEIVALGADILDIGGESSRPGAQPIGAEEELKRVIPVIEKISKNDILISVDTCKSQVAEKALSAGARMINDITGLASDEMARVIAKGEAYVVIMHMQGSPRDMQTNPHYEDVLDEISHFFSQRIEKARSFGIAEDKIILDPGIGFGKTLEHNLTILKNISFFKNRFPYPILIGTSRKGFIGKITGKENPSERIFGTAATVAQAILEGASIVRVHDVAEMKDVAAMADSIKNSK